MKPAHHVLLFVFLVAVYTAPAQSSASAQKDLPDTVGLFPNDMYRGQKVYTKTNPMPQYLGDLYNFLANNLVYPQAAGRWAGSAYATFIVDTSGQVQNPVVVKKSRVYQDVPQAIVDEYVSLIKRMNKWSPGYYNGKRVPVRIYLEGVLFEPGM